jgi:hypothetical protein
LFGDFLDFLAENLGGAGFEHGEAEEGEDAAGYAC